MKGIMETNQNEKRRSSLGQVIFGVVLIGLILVYYRVQSGVMSSNQHREHLVEEVDPYFRTGTHETPKKGMAEVVRPTLMDRLWQNKEVMIAYRTTTNYIAEILVAPASAQFSPIENTGVKLDGSYTTVSGYVDSQNSFGAMLRTKFTVLMWGNLSRHALEVKVLKFGDDAAEAVKLSAGK